MYDFKRGEREKERLHCIDIAAKAANNLYSIDVWAGQMSIISQDLISVAS